MIDYGTNQLSFSFPLSLFQQCSVFMDDGFGAMGDGIPDDRVFVEGHAYLQEYVLPGLL